MKIKVGSRVRLTGPGQFRIKGAAVSISPLGVDVLRDDGHIHPKASFQQLEVIDDESSPFEQQYIWEIQFVERQPSGTKCQREGCRGEVNWGWCSVHTPLHYRDLP